MPVFKEELVRTETSTSEDTEQCLWANRFLALLVIFTWGNRCPSCTACRHLLRGLIAYLYGVAFDGSYPRHRGVPGYAVFPIRNILCCRLGMSPEWPGGHSLS